MSTLDVSDNISSPISDDAHSFSDKNIEDDTDSISITSNTFSTYEFNSENETKQVYKRKKRSRCETQLNYDENESSNDQKNRYHKFNDSNENHHRRKRQAIHVNREFNVEEKSSKLIDNSKFNEDRKINTKHNSNKNKNNININNYTIESSSSQKEGYPKKQDYKLKNKNSSLDNQKDFMDDVSDAQNNSGFNNENIDIINKSNKNSKNSNKSNRNDYGNNNNDNDNNDDIGNTRRLNKKKYNNGGVENSRFWNIRNSSNTLRNYNNKIHLASSPSSKLNPQLINNTNGTLCNNNDSLLNYTLNSNKKKFPLSKRHENKITKKKKKNIVSFASAINQTNLLLPNTKMSTLHSLKKDKKLKKFGKSKVSSQGSSVHTKIHFPSPLSSNSTTMMNHSNSNNSTTSIPMDPNVSIRAIITTKEAGVIIGREGKNVTKIREESGAKVNVSEHVPGTLDRIITVAGDIDSVTKAFLLVSERIVVEFEKERRGLTGIPGFNGLISINHTHKSFEKEAKEDPKKNNKNKKSLKVIHESNKTESKSKDQESNTTHSSISSEKLISSENNHINGTMVESQIIDSSLPLIDNDDDATVNNDELNYTEEDQDINDTYSESYSIDITSHQENYNDENDDLQSFSEGLNHDDITKIMNTRDNQEDLNNYSENNYDNSSYDNNQDDENNSMMEDDVNTIVSTNDDQNETKLDSIELADIMKKTTSSANINDSSEEFSPDKNQETKEGIHEMDELEVQELFKREHLSLRILIPDTRMGSIIGKGGSKIKEIQDISGAYIIASEEILPNSTERTVIINGTVQAIKLAIYNIGIILRENPDRNLNTIYYKPMPLSFYQNSLSTLSYPLPFTPQIIPPNYAASSSPYPLPFYLNSSTINTTSTLPPQPNLPLPVGSFQPPPLPPPPPHSQYNSKFQFSKHYHKTFKNNNTTNKPINSTNISTDDNYNNNPGNSKNDNNNNNNNNHNNNNNNNNNNSNNNNSRLRLMINGIDTNIGNEENSNNITPQHTYVRSSTSSIINKHHNSIQLYNSKFTPYIETKSYKLGSSSNDNIDSSTNFQYPSYDSTHLLPYNNNVIIGKRRNSYSPTHSNEYYLNKLKGIDHDSYYLTSPSSSQQESLLYHHNAHMLHNTSIINQNRKLMKRNASRRSSLPNTSYIYHENKFNTYSRDCSSSSSSKNFFTSLSSRNSNKFNRYNPNIITEEITTGNYLEHDQLDSNGECQCEKCCEQESLVLGLLAENATLAKRIKELERRINSNSNSISPFGYHRNWKLK
jgi:predicted RNA-binding protein YlqC (UPF0109 family)